MSQSEEHWRMDPEVPLIKDPYLSNLTVNVGLYQSENSEGDVLQMLTVQGVLREYYAHRGGGLNDHDETKWNFASELKLYPDGRSNLYDLLFGFGRICFEYCGCRLIPPVVSLNTKLAIKHWHTLITQLNEDLGGDYTFSTLEDMMATVISWGAEAKKVDYDETPRQKDPFKALQTVKGIRNSPLKLDD